LDDDTEADPYWVLSIKECFASFPKAGAVTGLILPLEMETVAQELFEVNGGFERGFSRRVLPHDRKIKFGLKLPLVAEAIGVGSGCNMAIRTHILKELGGFDEALDTGPPLPGGGDLDIFYRVLRTGHELVYEPRALVRHRHRRTKAEIQAQLQGHHRSLSAFLIKTIFSESVGMVPVIALFLIWRLTKTGFRVIQRLIGKEELPLHFLLLIFWAGFVGLGSYQVSRLRIRRISQKCLV
jgi:GT2 family glycosyltransferase